MIDEIPKKRVLLSFLAAKTHRLLLLVLMCFCAFLGALYLFLLNRVAMQGYVLSREAQKKTDISQTLEALDGRLLRFDTDEYINKKTESGYSYTTTGNRKFLFVKETFTARR